MTSIVRRSLSFIVIAAMAGGAVWWFTRPQPIPVRLVEVTRGTVEATVSNTRAGEIEACQRIRLSTILGGRIEYLGVREGDRVEAGQVLMRLWQQDLDSRLAVAEAQLTTARNRADEVCTTAANAERDAARQRTLAARGFVADARADAAQAEALARRASCAAARADVATAERQREAARVDVGRVTIVAPFAGTVARITGELGEYSTPSPPGVPTPPAIDLIDDSCLYVKVPMDEIDAPKIQPGQPARVTLDALPGRVFEARVTRVAPYITAVERQSRTVDVDLAFVRPQEAHGLLVGYSTDVEIILAVREDTLRIPTATLLEGNRVYVYRETDGTLQARQLRIGVANWELSEVLDGLVEGERIVTSLEREGLADGVRVVPEDAPAPTAR